MENPENTSEEEKERQKYIEGLKEAEKLMNEIQQFREFSYAPDFSYVGKTQDYSYKALLDFGGFTKHDHDLIYKRIYPSQEEIAERRRQGIRTKWNEAHWKDPENNVYVKEFRKPPEEIAAEIAQMKVGYNPDSALPKLPEDMSIGVVDFKHAKEDIERYIGENLIAKIGFAVIFIGVMIAYRLAISYGYVPIYLRVTIGVLLGSLFFTGAHRLAKEENTLTSLLITVANFAFYYTVSLTVHDYGLISDTVGFFACLFITFITGVASVFYNRRILSYLSVAGGYATPYLMYGTSLGFNQFFGYLLVFNAGLLVIAYLKNWRFIHAITFTFFIVILFVRWLHTNFDIYANAFGLLVFSSLFYIVFFVAKVAYSVKKDNTYDTTAAIMLWSNVIWFLIFGIYAVHKTQLFSTGTMLLVFGLFHGGYAAVLFGKKQAWQPLMLQLTNIALLMLIFAIYLLAASSYINNVLAMSALFLLWLGLEIKLTILKNYAKVLLFLSMISLLGVWTDVYIVGGNYELFFNKAFWGSFVMFLGLVLAEMLLKEEPDLEKISGFIPNAAYKQFLANFLSVIAYFAIFFELAYNSPFLRSEVRALLINTYNLSFVVVFRFITMQLGIKRYRFAVGVLMVLFTATYLLYGHYNAHLLRDEYIQSGNFAPFGFHYVSVALSAYIVYLLVKDIVFTEEYVGVHAFALWFMSGVFVAHATIEMENILFIIAHKGFAADSSAALVLIRQTGYSALWGLISLLLMYIGIRFHLKDLRTISLSLFGFTICKFLIWDFTSMSAVGQIISFIFLGTLLLVASRMYENLKLLVKQGRLYAQNEAPLTAKGMFSTKGLSSLFSKKNKKE